nr:uncharacterized protein LOC121118131 [Lepeophtheirus salmonis]
MFVFQLYFTIFSLGVKYSMADILSDIKPDSEMAYKLIPLEMVDHMAPITLDSNLENTKIFDKYKLNPSFGLYQQQQPINNTSSYPYQKRNSKNNNPVNFKSSLRDGGFQLRIRKSLSNDFQLRVRKAIKNLHHDWGLPSLDRTNFQLRVKKYNYRPSDHFQLRVRKNDFNFYPYYYKKVD